MCTWRCWTQWILWKSVLGRPYFRYGCQWNYIYAFTVNQCDIYKSWRLCNTSWIICTTPRIICVLHYGLSAYSNTEYLRTTSRIICALHKGISVYITDCLCTISRIILYSHGISVYYVMDYLRTWRISVSCFTDYLCTKSRITPFTVLLSKLIIR